MMPPVRAVLDAMSEYFYGVSAERLLRAVEWRRTYDHRWRNAVLDNIRTWGAPGSPICGSRWERGYCRTCGAPMRVDTAPDIESRAQTQRRLMGQACSCCSAASHPGYNPCGMYGDDDPSFHDVVRLYEDGQPMSEAELAHYGARL
jgi:AcrR family transcriptional regulator